MSQTKESEVSRQPSSFLLAFEEPHTESSDPSMKLATQTGTKTFEEPDADPERLAGTGTMTATVEDPDQDPQLLGTKTMTETSEGPDQDVAPSYFAIPRV